MKKAENVTESIRSLLWKGTVQNVCLLQVRLQSQSSVLSGTEKYTLDQFAVSDVKSVLRDQQQAIQVELVFDQDPGISPPPGEIVLMRWAVKIGLSNDILLDTFYLKISLFSPKTRLFSTIHRKKISFMIFL